MIAGLAGLPAHTGRQSGQTGLIQDIGRCIFTLHSRHSTPQEALSAYRYFFDLYAYLQGTYQRSAARIFPNAIGICHFSDNTGRISYNPATASKNKESSS